MPDAGQTSNTTGSAEGDVTVVAGLVVVALLVVVANNGSYDNGTWRLVR